MAWLFRTCKDQHDGDWSFRISYLNPLQYALYATYNNTRFWSTASKKPRPEKFSKKLGSQSASLNGFLFTHDCMILDGLCGTHQQLRWCCRAFIGVNVSRWRERVHSFGSQCASVNGVSSHMIIVSCSHVTIWHMPSSALLYCYWVIICHMAAYGMASNYSVLMIFCNALWSYPSHSTH